MGFILHEPAGAHWAEGDANLNFYERKNDKSHPSARAQARYYPVRASTRLFLHGQ